MQILFRFDKDGYYIEPVILHEIFSKDNPMPDDLTSIRPPDGLFRARYTGTNSLKDGVWVSAGEWIEIAPSEAARFWKVVGDVEVRSQGSEVSEGAEE